LFFSLSDYFPESLRLSGELMARCFAVGEFISMVVKINPERVAPAASWLAGGE
jgi:hypothetical protein